MRLSDYEVDTLSPLRRSPPERPVVVCAGDEELPAIRLACTALARYLGTEPEILRRCDHFSVLDELTHPHGRLCDIAIEMVA